MRILLVLAFTSLTLGCGQQTEFQADCLEHCDDHDSTVAAPLVSCWLVPGDDDGFFRTDQLHCRYTPETAAPIKLFAVNAELTTGQDQDLRILASETLSSDPDTETQVGAFFADKYPVDLDLHFVYGANNNDDVIGASSLTRSKHSFHIESALDATLEAPLTQELPFQVWDLELLNRSAADAHLRFDHELALDGNAEAIRIKGSLSTVAFGMRARHAVVVPLSTSSLPTSLALSPSGATPQEIQTELPGPGIYEVSAEGDLSALKASDLLEPSGELSAQCWPEQHTSPADPDCEPGPAQNIDCTPQTLTEIVCLRSLNAAIGEVSVQLLATEMDPLAATLGSTEVRFALEEAEFNFPVQIQFLTLVNEGIIGTEGLPSDRTHRSSSMLASAESELVEGRLPFLVWSVLLSPDSQLLFFSIELAAYDLDLGYQWGNRFALRVEPTFIDLEFATQSEFQIAVSPGTQALDGTGLAVKESGEVVEDIKIELQAGRWNADAGGLTPLR